MWRKAVRYDDFAARRLGISRNRALELIKAEQIALNDKFFKPSFDVSALSVFKTPEALMDDRGLNLRLLGPIYVSRAALKLRDFLEQTGLCVRGRSCLDVGASTGGFVQVLLARGARSVLAVDVGAGQLDGTLRRDERVRSLENTDFRAFKSEEKFELLTCDVSFISLLKLLPALDGAAGKDLILLFKPQFEVGREAKRDKKGVLRDAKSIIRAREDFEKACANLGWVLKNQSVSSLAGKEGNVEHFYHFCKD